MKKALLRLFTLLIVGLLPYGQEAKGEAPTTRVELILSPKRHYASRYLEQKNILQLRIYPARIEEIKPFVHLPPSLIRNVVYLEKNGEVIVEFHMGKYPLMWVVEQKNAPWRIMVDFWKTEGKDKGKSWSWQKNNKKRKGRVSSKSRKGTSSLKDKNKSKKISSISRKKRTKCIDIPGVKSSDTKCPRRKKSRRIKRRAGSVRNFSSVQKRKNEAPYNVALIGRIEKVLRKNKLSLNKSNVKKRGSFDAKLRLARELFQRGNEAEVLEIVRKMAYLEERKFKNNPEIIKLAGESAFLTGDKDLAYSYFWVLEREHPISFQVGRAKLRKLDLAYIKQRKSGKRFMDHISNNVQEYQKIALEPGYDSPTRIAASLRLLHGLRDFKDKKLKLHSKNIDECVNKSIVHIELKKRCDYIYLRYRFPEMDILEAAEALKKFQVRAPDPEAALELSNELKQKVMDKVNSFVKGNNWEGMVQFENKIPTELLGTVSKNEKITLFRAESWEKMGYPAQASLFYLKSAEQLEDEKKQLEALALAALNARLSFQEAKAKEILDKLKRRDERVTQGLSRRAIDALRKLAEPPYYEKTAMTLLLDEMDKGRHTEKSLSVLVSFQKVLSSGLQQDRIMEKILSFPVKTAAELSQVESLVWDYAVALKRKGRLAKAADMYLAVARLDGGVRRGQAAYNAGILYSRIGMLGKARESWQLAAGDNTDSRFQTLAQERLERLQ